MSNTMFSSRVLQVMMRAVRATVMTAVAVGAYSLIGHGAVSANSGCYIEDESGQLYDLVDLCGGFGGSSNITLQTGDVQVTLRWDTSDDVDLFVTDPAGETVSYGNPSVSSGGQLDVDANAFCEIRMSAPVENIFWPTGGAPTGSYSAYVVLSIPCGSTPTPVSYSLTILAQGQTQTFQGIVSAEAASQPYAFAIQ
jgi:hypothetical protein